MTVKKKVRKKTKKTNKSTSKGGRPSKYKEQYCIDVVEYGKTGKTIAEFASSIGVHEDTLYQWAKVHAPFSEAKALAKQGCAAWWLDMGRKNLELGMQTKFTSAVWVFAMKNIGGWRDKVGHNTDGDEGFKIIIEDYKTKK